MAIKLVIDDLADLKMKPVKLRPTEGYTAARVPYDFEVAIGVGNETIGGRAGEYVVSDPDGHLTVVSQRAFGERFARVLGPKDAGADPAGTETLATGVPEEDAPLHVRAGGTKAEKAKAGK